MIPAKKFCKSGEEQVYLNGGIQGLLSDGNPSKPVASYIYATFV